MIRAQQWVSWIVATAAAAFTMMSYVHANFMTVREKGDIISRLDRIQESVDQLKHEQ